MQRKKVTVKGVDVEAWVLLKVLQQEERRYLGAILSDCIRLYYDSEEIEA